MQTPNAFMSAGKRSCPDIICYLLSVMQGHAHRQVADGEEATAAVAHMSQTRRPRM